ncbi:MAG: hypothetical protein LBI43_06600 [Streptococcaceae bacterium]|nr:hypothetical protein [Streptococcaceae bacterium]
MTVEITLELVKKLVAEQYPGYADLPIRKVAWQGMTIGPIIWAINCL